MSSETHRNVDAVATEIMPIGATWRDADSRAITRRHVIRLLGAGTAGVAGLGLAWWPALAQDATPEPSAAGTPVTSDTGGSLTIYSGRSETLVAPIIERFAEETGIATEVRYAGTSELTATILEEGADSPADLFLAQDAGALGLLAAEGRFQTLSDDILDRVEERFRSLDGNWVGVSGRARVLVYNTDELEEADLPASVLDLTGEEWRGRVGWAPENASFQSFVTALRVLEGDDAARTWLEGMLANETVNFADSNSAIVKAVGDGELPVGLVNHYYVFALKKEEGDDFPVANHYFAAGDPGSLVNVAGVGILESVANTEQAERFVDFLLSEEAQTYFAEETSEYPLIAGVDTVGDIRPLADVGSPEIDLSDLADLQGTVELLTEVGVL